MLKIKLARFGKKHQPHFRFVVTEARSKRDGKYVENIGHYAPTQTPKILKINIERYQYWVKQGAVPTDTVAGLFKRYQSGNPFPTKKKKLSKKAKAKKLETKEAKDNKESQKTDDQKTKDNKTDNPTKESEKTETKEKTKDTTNNKPEEKE